MMLQALEATYDQARAEAPAAATRLRLLPSTGASELPATEHVSSSISGVAGLELPFVGRSGAFERLVAAYERACAGQARVVLVEGEAGIGKTRLAEEFLRWAAAHGADVLRGAAIEPRGWPPYQVVADALRPRLARGRAPGDLLTDAWLAELGRLFPELRERYPDLPPPAALPTGDSPGQGWLHEAVAQLTLALAERARPGALVLVIDDAQWADPDSLELLRHLARARVALPLLLVVTYRSDELDRRHPLTALVPLLVREAPTERLALRPLDAAAVRALVGARYDLPAGEATRLAAYLVARTAGNALFLTELLRTLEENQLLRQEGYRWAPGNLADAPVPLLLRQIVNARLARFDDAEDALLTVAAVIGQEVPLDLWQAVAGAEEATVEAALERAEAAHLVRAWPGGDGLEFGNALIREVLYEAIPALRRRRLHQQVGEALIARPDPDPDAVAYHLQRAGDDRAATWLVRAGERAEDAAALHTAAARYGAAVTLLDAQRGDPAERGWLRLLAAALRADEESARTLAWIEDALRLAAEAADASLAARALALRGMRRCSGGQVRAGMADLDAATAAADRLPPGTGVARRREQRVDACANRGTLIAFLAYSGQLAEACAQGERHLARVSAAATAPAEVGALADVHAGLSLAYTMRGDPELARRSYAAAIAAYAAIHDHARAFGKQREELLLRVLPYHADDPAERERVAAAAERAASRLSETAARDDTYRRACARVPLHVLEGRWGEARRILEQPDGADATLAFDQEFRNLYAGLIARAQGDAAGAWHRVRAVWPGGPRTEPGELFVQYRLPLQRLAAALALDAGDLPAARAWLDAHRCWLDFTGATLGRAEAAALEAQWHRAAGDRAAAREHAERALAHAAAPRQPLALLVAHRALGSVDAEAGDRTAAEGHFAAALALADACRAPYERALTLLALAELLAMYDERAGALAALDEARRLCLPLDARFALDLAERISGRLTSVPGRVAAATGAAAPDAGVPPSSPSGLSARELEVLRMLAEGLDNAVIAERLFLSPRTVKSHVANIYGKLGVTNRAAATRFALDHGLA